MSEAGRYQHALDMYIMEQSDLKKCLDFAKTCEHTIDSVEGVVNVVESFTKLKTFVDAYLETYSRGNITDEQIDRATTMFVEDTANYPTKTILYRDVPEYLQEVYEYSGKINDYVTSVCTENPSNEEQLGYICDTYMEAFIGVASTTMDKIKPKQPERMSLDKYLIF